MQRLALSVSGDPISRRRWLISLMCSDRTARSKYSDGGRELGHEFFLGSHWESKVPSDIVFEGIIGERIELKNSAWLISDFELDDYSALVKLVTDVYQAGYASLVILAKSFSEQIIAAQGANSRMEDFQLIYLEPTGLGRRAGSGAGRPGA